MSAPKRLAAATLLTILTAGAAGAQQAEEITVTAPSTGRGAPASTTILSAEDIARSGAATVGSLLDQLPAFGSQGVNAAQNDGGFGEYFIDLRNLNFDRTLVLVDGKRFVLSGIKTDEAVDLNNIPASFIDHIEILRDGSQPQYAADAVAGVVNIVLKDQIEGLHLSAYGAATGHADGGTSDISLTGGQGFAHGHVAFGLDVYQRDAVPQSARDWSAVPIASAVPGAVLFGAEATPGGHAVAPGIDALALGGGAFRPFNPLTDDYNPAPGRDLQGSLQRETAYFDADAALTDSVNADVELLYSDRTATNLDPAQMLGLTATVKHPAGFTIPDSDPYNPFGQTVTLERVVTEAGPQQTTTSGPVWRVLGGVSGTLGNDWAWTVSFDHGQSLSHYAVENDINLTRALQTAGNGPCPADQGCVEADWFGPGSLSPQALQYIRYTGRSQSDYDETVGQARLSGPLLTAPGGVAKLALGAEARNEFGATSVDGVTATGNQAGTDAAPSGGGYATLEAYGTLAVPLVRDLPWARRIDLTMAARETAINRYGGLPSYRGAVEYAPAAGMTLRAVSGAARRPPAISEAFGGITASPAPVGDPCAAGNGLRANPVVNANCLSQGLGPGFAQASPLINVVSGGNPHLRPEQSENEMFGVTFRPPAVPALSATLDYYHYRIRDAIDSLEDTDPNLVPDVCYESAHLSSPTCRLISRISGGGNAGQIGDILGLDQNVGTIKTDGLELGLGIAPPAGALGQFRFDAQVNYLLNYRLHTEGVPGFVQYAGTFPGLNAVGSYARVRALLTADWQLGMWHAGYTARLISGARVLGAVPGAPFSRAPDIVYHDIEAARGFGKLTVAVGMDNIADQNPPTLVDGSTNTDTNTYDVLGRVIWARLSYDF